MTGVAVRGSKLVFKVDGDQVELHLGPEVAQRWAKAIASPLPDLASKLGISTTTRLSVVGDVQSEELKAAIAQGTAAAEKEIDLTLICINSQSEAGLASARPYCSGPLWIVYPKGANSPVKESQCESFSAATASSTPK